MGKKIIIGADPLGVALKDAVKVHLLEKGHAVEDIGGFVDQEVAYYRVGEEVGRRISSGEFDLGFIFCGTGMGVNIVANKFPGVYCGLCESVMSARLCRIITNCNVLSMGGLFQGKYKALEMVDAFLDAEFTQGFTEASPEFLQDAFEQVQKFEKNLR